VNRTGKEKGSSREGIVPARPDPAANLPASM
jgi:hypothetical protein